jgi:nitrous oxide reductase accessory protein NosL
MKRFVLLLLAVLLAVPAVAAEQPDVTEFPSCKYCGMDRAKFAHSRMLVEYDDGSRVPTCSLHCTAVDLANNLNHAPVSLQVGNMISHELLDAQTAMWVVGGSRPGVMSGRAKWAFADREQAEKFVAEAGGTVDTFENAIKAAYEDMYRDTLMIREKRKAKMKHKP